MCDTPVGTTRWITGQDRNCYQKLISTGGRRGIVTYVLPVEEGKNWNKKKTKTKQIEQIQKQVITWLVKKAVDNITSGREEKAFCYLMTVDMDFGFVPGDTECFDKLPRCD